MLYKLGGSIDTIAFFYLYDMANCRIQNLTPTCGYNGDGVVSVLLLDFEDFIGFTFEGNASYASCFVEKILHNGTFVITDLPDFPAQYTGSFAAGLYSHSIEAFIAELSAPILADLHLATKRPQLVVFKTRTGRYFTFGHDIGAKATYTAQTTDNTGAVLTLAASSEYPLFEVSPKAFEIGAHPATYTVLFDDKAFCEIDGETDSFNGYQQAIIAVKVSIINGEPLDANGVPISISGLKQAALMLSGEMLLDQYDIVGFYPLRGTVNGEPTVRYAPDICEEGMAGQWILDTGFWDTSAYWLSDGVWNY